MSTCTWNQARAAGMLLIGLLGCGGSGAVPPPDPAATDPAALRVVRDTIVATTFDAPGTAEPLLHSTLSTRLMGTVRSVVVQEGDRVAAGQLLARVDARDLDARQRQAAAALGAAEAVRAEARTQAERFRGLYADSAATRHQLERAETGLAQAEAAVEAALSAQHELSAIESYAEVVAPFAGTVTRRYVDPGAFAAPGAPLFDVQSGARLRIGVVVPPQVAAGLAPGQHLVARIEGQRRSAVIEGLVPASGGSYRVNALVENPGGTLLPGSAASLAIPTGTHRAILIPAAILHKEGDLVGVRVLVDQKEMVRWLKVAPAPVPVDSTDLVEVLSGIAAGDTLIVRGD